MSKHGSSAQLLTTVQTSSLTENDMVELDPYYKTSLQTSLHYDRCASPSFLIVIMEEGSYDASTYGVFLPIAKYLQAAIGSLYSNPGSSDAPPRVVISRCTDLRFCTLSDDTRYVVVLGAHHLARYERAQIRAPHEASSGGRVRASSGGRAESRGIPPPSPSPPRSPP
jgi:hypothetical protein